VSTYQPPGPTGYTCPMCRTFVPNGVVHSCAITPYPNWPPQPALTVPPRMGWECPKCGGVYAPSMPMCTRCGPKETS
jgi:hypothetical protein